MKTKMLIMILLLVGSTSFRAGDTDERSGDFVAIKDVSGIRLSTRWITDPIIQDNLIESMDAFRKILREYESEKPANHGTHS